MTFAQFDTLNPQLLDSVMLQGNAEVERARQAARQAELLASEAKKGDNHDKNKVRARLAWLLGSLT